MKPIKKIIVFDNVSLKSWACEVGKDGVEEIKDRSIESESGIFTAFYALDKNGEIIREILGCSVDIERE
jgi:hypothetical protein